jgi:hypothetical protein
MDFEPHLRKKLQSIEVLHDLYGNPFRPVHLKDTWLTWRDGTIPRLARAAYQERDADDRLDAQRLAILADALEEAGCAEADLLAHLRSGGIHVRGCWAIDLLNVIPA